MSSSGKLAEDGAGLKQRFKRAVVAGGKHKGARYTDLAEAEIRRCATSYRGDPRFAQYCKQWVSLHLLSPVEEASSSQMEKEGMKPETTSATWSAWAWDKLKKAALSLRAFARGRKLLAFFFLLSLVLLVSRPSFGTLSSKLTVLVIRGVLRRSLGFLASVIDAVLDEAIEQVESALTGQHLPPPHQLGQPNEPYVHPPVPIIENTWHWIAHVFLVICTFYRRTVPAAA